MGVPEDEATAMIHASNNPDFLGLLAGVPIPRDAFEEGYEDVMTARTWSWEVKSK